MSEVVDLVRSRLRFRPGDPASRVLSPAPPIDAITLSESEATLGFQLPMELKRLYSEIGNGGFGPGYGLLGLLRGATDDLGDTAVSGYLTLRERGLDVDVAWPERLVPICNWGCAIYSCIDCSTSTYEMMIFDPNPHEDPCANWTDAFFQEGCGFAEWIESWARGMDLWARLYGERGVVTAILTNRQIAR